MSDYKQLLEELPCPCCGLKKTELARLKELNREMVEVLQELVNIVDDSMTGEYKIDSFTTQPARELLSDEKWVVQDD